MATKTTTKEWKKVKVGDIGEYLNGFPFKPSQWGHEGYPIIRIQNLNNKTKKFNYYNGKVPEKYLIRKNDILISWSASLGVYLWDKEYGWLNQHIFKATPNEGAVDRNFFYWVMYSAISGIAEHARGSTMKHVTKLIFDNYELNIPSERSEQIGIARVLTTVQIAIAEQENLIGKLQELKRSMMQHLFTHGTKGEKTKMVETGEVPESWDIVELGDVCRSKVVDGVHKTPKYISSGIPFITAKDIDDGKVSFEKCRFISEEDHKILSRRVPLEENDILMTKVGSVGKLAVVGSDANYSIFVQVALIKPNDKVDSKFLFYFLQWEKMQQKIIENCAQSTMKFIGTQKIARLPVLLPEIKIQKQIGETISLIDEDIAIANSKVSAYQNLFKTLLHELMSGERRIKT